MNADLAHLIVKIAAPPVIAFVVGALKRLWPSAPRKVKAAAPCVLAVAGAVGHAIATGDTSGLAETIAVAATAGLAANGLHSMLPSGPK